MFIFAIEKSFGMTDGSHITLVKAGESINFPTSNKDQDRGAHVCPNIDVLIWHMEF